MKWYTAAEYVRPYVFKIATPRGSGTGFLVSLSTKTDLIAIATAAHVIDSAHYWEEPIRIDHAGDGGSMFIREADRAILIDEQKDSAAIVIARGHLDLPTVSLQLETEGKHLKVGNEIGWLGFPAIPGAELCFFTGTTSAWVSKEHAYLVDGVAINGVSGGPAFQMGANNQITLVGLVSAYAPNRATGETLPGLSIIRDVSQFHEVARRLKNLDEAKAKEAPPAAPPTPVQNPTLTKTRKG